MNSTQENSSSDIPIETVFLPDEAHLYAPVKAHIEQIQAMFEVYQRTHFTARPPEFFSLELCGEAGELANLEKKLWKGNATISHEAVSDEAADVCIALMNYANARGVNLGDAVAAKLRRIEEKRQMLATRGEAY
jgi:NTP pyrophosphatase (non-canonical NTP hydrolase)